MLNTTTHQDVGVSWSPDMLRSIRVTHWQKAIFQAPSEMGRRLSLASSLHQRVRERREHLFLGGFRARPLSKLMGPNCHLLSHDELTNCGYKLHVDAW